MSAAADRNYCGYNGCRRIIRRDATRCYQHIDSFESAPSGGKVNFTASQEADRLAILDSLLKSGYIEALIVPRSAVPSDRQSRGEEIVDGTMIEEEALSHVLDLVEDLERRYGDLSVPEVAVSAHWDNNDKFRADLSERLPGRVTSMVLRGYHYRLPNGKVIDFPEGGNRVTIIDRDTPTETVVDPFASMFAPVQDGETPVEEQRPFGETIYGDVPLICSVDEYIDSGHGWWDAASFRDA